MVGDIWTAVFVVVLTLVLYEAQTRWKKYVEARRRRIKLEKIVEQRKAERAAGWYYDAALATYINSSTGERRDEDEFYRPH